MTLVGYILNTMENLFQNNLVYGRQNQCSLQELSRLVINCTASFCTKILLKHEMSHQTNEVTFFMIRVNQQKLVIKQTFCFLNEIHNISEIEP